MNFYIDFEATQPEQEIISIGAVADNGATFHALIKPQFSSISKYISDMTGITQQMIETAKTFDCVMRDFYQWCTIQESYLIKWHFYSYGDSDVDFLKHTLQNVISENALIITSLMISTMKDYSKEVAKYFRGGTSLIKAFNYLETLENKQKHNALEDATMLADIYNKIDGKEPLESNPFIEQKIINYTFPSGEFYCTTGGKNYKERHFVSIHDAMEWLINNHIGKEARDTVRRDKMATKIMKAIRKKDTYMGYKWRREK